MQAYGLQHFDHLGGALLVLVQYSIPDSAYDVLHTALESEPSAAGLSLVLFLSVTCINTFIMVGLVLAVINETFNEASAAEAHHDHKEITDLGSSLPSSIDCMEETTSARLAARNFLALKLLLDDRITILITAAIVVHSTITIIYAQYRNWLHHELFILQILTNAVFISELCLRFAADRFQPIIFKKAFNMFELAMVICGISGLLLDHPVLGLMTIFRLYRLMRYFPTMNYLLMNLMYTKQTFLQLIMFSGMNFLSFAVLARYVFRNKMEEYTVSNFSDLGQALLTTFQLFTGDKWR